MLPPFLCTLLKLSKTTSSNKLVDYDCVTLYLPYMTLQIHCLRQTKSCVHVLKNKMYIRLRHLKKIHSTPGPGDFITVLLFFQS